MMAMGMKIGEESACPIEGLAADAIACSFYLQVAVTRVTAAALLHAMDYLFNCPLADWLLGG